MDMKEKFKKIGKVSYIVITSILSVLFIIVCIIGGVMSSNNKQNQPKGKIVDYESSEILKLGNKKYVSFNDETYTISLSVDDVNDFVFYNLNQYLVSEDFQYSHGFDGEIDFVYDDVTFDTTYSDGVEQFPDDLTPYYTVGMYPVNSNDDYFICFNGLVEDERFTLLGDYKFHTNYDNSGEYGSFDYGLNIVVTNSTIYSPIKAAIQADIIYNSSPISIDIFETLSGSIFAFVGSLNSGITAMVSVFYYNNALTPIGLLSVIIVSITLAYFLFRLIIGLIRMRG